MNPWAIKSESPISNDWAIANEMPMSNEWEVEEEETLKEPSLLQKTNKIAGQLAAGITYYSGLEGFGRLWDSPANVGYGIWEGGKKALKGEGIGQLVKEPIKAAEKTLRGEPYYDLEQAGLPVPEGKIARTGAEIAWAIGKNPLNVLVPWKQYKAIKTTPATITPSQLKKALGKKEAEEIFEVIKEEPVVGKPAVPEVKKSDTARINALLKEVEGEAGVKVKVKVKAEQPWEIAQETALDESGKFKEVFKEGERGKPEDIMTPPGPAKEIYSYEGKQFKTYQLKESTAVKVPSLKETIENLPETGVIKGTKEKLKRAGRGISEAAHSPEEVYAKDPAGKKIYKLVDQADQKKNAFLAEQGKALKVAVWKVKEGSEGSVRIGQALDGKISPDKLNPAERKAYDFMKEQYDFLLQKYARTEAGSEEGYLKVLRAAGSKYGAKVKVSELPQESLDLYNRLKSALLKTEKGTERYGKIKEEMDGLLSRGWKETLKPGEQKAHDVLSRKIKDYLPHIFDKEELLDAFRNEVTTIEKKLKTATNKGTITQFKDRLKLLNESIVKMEGGQLVTYDQLPTNVRFRFFETRKGKAGYSFDSVKAYQTYLQGIARKIYDEPAIRQVAELHKELDPSLKSYNKWYVRRYMGWDKHALDEVAGTIASFQCMRTLGLNPRSAIVSLTQRVNTVAEVGVKHSAIGEKLAFTKKGKALFDKTGIAKEIPTVLMEGTVPAGMEKTRAILGFMFNKVELGNRRHAFLSAYSEAKSKGMTEQAAIESGIDIVHKTQFRYGKVGMPKMLTHPVGRLAGQFWSYPIKQIELMTKWAKTPTGRVKLIKYLAMAEGGNYALDEFLGIDLSNALGFGLNYGEAIDALGDLTEGDLRGFWRHTRLTFSSGGGLLPSGLGPTASGVGKVIGAIGKGRGVEQVKKELTPVEGKRIMQAYTAIKNRKGDLFPIYDSKKHLMYYVTKKDLALRTLGPRPAKEGKEYLEWNRERLLEDERKEVLKDQINAIIAHDISKAIKLKTKYGVYPSDKAIENEIERRTLSRREQGRLKAIGQKEEYQLMREGKLIRR